MKGMRKRTFTGDKVPGLTRFLYPFSGIFRDACYALVGSFLLTYAMTTGVLSSNPEVYQAQYNVITVAMMIALIWDGINDPIMGFIVEKVHFPWGKFKPWILIGAVGNALAVCLMFLVRLEGVNDGWAFVGCMIAFYFLWDLFFTMNDVGYWSMLPSLTNDEHERAKLTSHVTLCASIGGFLMTAACFLLPSAFASAGGAGAGKVYGIIAIVISILFLVFQAFIFFFCQEKERDAAQEAVSENTKIVDLFRIVWKNKQLLWTVIAMFLYYLACGVLTGGIGLYYFYLNLGYGSWQGGLAATLISVVYVVGNVAAQALYPVIAKKMSKQKMLLIFSCIGFAAYLAFFLCCVPVFGAHPLAYNDPTPYLQESGSLFIENMGTGLAWALGGSMILYYIIPLVFFFTQGMIYMIILMMYQGAIDYQEWKFGERKESVAFAWRPLTVKLSSAMLRLFQAIIFAAAGASAYFTAVSNAEGDYNMIANTVDASTPAGQAAIEAAAAARNLSIYNAWQKVEPSQLVVYGAITVGVILVSMLVVLLLLRFKYEIPEELSAQITEELAARKEQAAPSVKE